MVSGSICPLGATARCRGRGSGTGQWGWRLPEPGGTTHAGAGRAVVPGGTARTTACCWGRRAVVMWWLVVGPFKLKFDSLNSI
jgi:hypothetical protein